MVLQGPIAPDLRPSRAPRSDQTLSGCDPAAPETPKSPATEGTLQSPAEVPEKHQKKVNSVAESTTQLQEASESA